jgi:hypothetical protein
MADRSLPPILPLGTRVVARVAVRVSGGGRELPAGATGTVVAAPSDATHAYRVRFPDGAEATLRRAEIRTWRHSLTDDTGGTPDLLADFRLHEKNIVYRCIVGSRAFGLETEVSDVDRRGVFLPPAYLHWSLHGVPEQIENPDDQECYWELGKFLRLALKANPNVLECLWTPEVEFASPLAEEMRGMRGAFLSRLVYRTYNGYTLSQFKKMEQDLRTAGAVKWKHAMHLLRLLLSGAEVLREGELRIRMGEHRDRLLAIRRGEVPWEEVDAWRLSLHAAFDEAFRETRLPEVPDYERVNAFLLRARRSVL